MGAGAGNVDIVIDSDVGEWPGAQGERFTRRGQPRAGHAEARLGVGGFPIVEPGQRKGLPCAFLNGGIGRIAAFELEIGPPAARFSEGFKVGIGEADAAIGAAAINAEEVFGHDRISSPCSRRTILRLRIGRKYYEVKS